MSSKEEEALETHSKLADLREGISLRSGLAFDLNKGKKQ